MRAHVGYAGGLTVDPIDQTHVFATRAVALAVVLTLAMGACTAVAATGAGSAAVPKVDKVVVVVLENKEFPEVIGSGEAPTFDLLAARYALLTDYHGVTHPSLPNYLALVSGSTHGVTSDCTSCRVAAQSLADTLERAG